MSFVRFKLDDEDPNADPSVPSPKQPVILVHGWTSDNSTWFLKCPNESPFIQRLSAEALHTWAFEYPNIGPIRHSAAGLAAAAEYVRGLYATPPKVRLVAHSMGGLVCRTYLQGFAVDPGDGADNGSCENSTAVGTVSHLVTLSSPLLGAAGAPRFLGKLARETVVQRCSEIFFSYSLVDLADAGKLVQDLNCAALPIETKYFFAGGYDAFAEGGALVGGARSDILSATCTRGNDGVVDLCSAMGECGGLHPTTLTFMPQGDAVRSYYELSHSQMSLPGAARVCQDDGWKLYEFRRYEESKRLLDDVVGFLLDDSSRPNDMGCRTYEEHGVIVEILDALSPLFSGSDQTISSMAYAMRAEGSDASPVAGALVRIGRPDNPDGDGGMLVSTDALGKASAGLAPGRYLITVSGRGYAARVETLAVDASGSDVYRKLSLMRDSSFQGPRHPQLLINGGAATTPDSMVTLTMACSGATEVIVSDSTGFAGAAWQPVTATGGYVLRGGRGRHLLQAKYRDGLGIESDSVSAVIELVDDAVGAITVTSSPVSGEIILDGAPTGRLTPATLDSLGVGYHRVGVQAAGWRVSPPLAAVLVDSGVVSQASFALTSSAPPEAPVWLAPLPSTFAGPDQQLEWTQTADPDPGDNVFYDVLVKDAVAATVWSSAGIGTTRIDLPVVLEDSTTYTATVFAVDGHLASQSSAAAATLFGVDRTSPSVQVIFPAEGLSVLPGSTYDLRWVASDWSGVDSVTALLSRDGGSTFPETIFHGEANDSSFLWNVQAPAAFDCRLRLIAYDRAGNSRTIEHGPFHISTATGVEEEETLPRVFALHANQPNPFNPTTTIRFDLPVPTRATLRVFDSSGRLVTTLADVVKPAGRYSVTWKGTNLNGVPVASGVYFARLNAGPFGAVRKLVLLK